MSDERKETNIEGQGVVAPGTPSTEGAPASVVMVNCKTCGAETPRTGVATKYCAACRKEREKKRNADNRAGKKSESFVFDSKTEPSKPEALALLEERGIKHPHIQKIVHAALVRLAEEQHIPANRFLFANGALAAQRSYELKEGQPLDEKFRTDEDVLGELLGNSELYALYDAFFAPHYPEDSFADYLKYRFRAKNDLYYLGHIMGFDGFSDCHKRWAYDFFPRWNPIGLPRKYTLQQRNNWAAAQSPIKDRLLLASRRAFKSTAGRVLVAALLITCWDAKVIYISETRPLAKQNIEAVRGFFEVEAGIDNPYVKFQRLFPEACIPKDDGSVMTYNHPCARLRLPGANVESSSMDSSTAGRRSTLILGDDIISEETSGNEEIRAKQIKKWSMVCKLREKGTYTIQLATPYHEEDCYANTIDTRASKKHQDLTFLHRVDPAFTLKPQARHKLTPALVSTITLDDIDSFLMPDLPWEELQVDMRTSPRAFLSQNLCIFPKDDDDSLQVQFTHEAIWKRVRTMSEMGSHTPVIAKNFLAIDRSGGSIARTADFQCAVVGRVQVVNGHNAAVVVDAKLSRARDSEFITETLVPLIRQHSPQMIIFEKDRGWSDFEQTLRVELLKRSIPVPWIRTLPIDNSPKAKAKAIKRLEVPLATGRLYFNAAIADLEACLLQLEKFDGTPSHSTRKDDFPDSLHLLCEALLPGTFVEVETDADAERRKKQREQNLKEEESRRQRQEYHDRMHGGPQTGYVSTAKDWAGKSTEPAPEPQPAPQPAHAKRFPMGGSFVVLPPGMRGGPRR